MIQKTRKISLVQHKNYSTTQNLMTYKTLDKIKQRDINKHSLKFDTVQYNYHNLQYYTKNNFIKISKYLNNYRFENNLLDYQNNYKENLTMVSNKIKNFDILGTSKIIRNCSSYPLFILHYFGSSTKFADLDLNKFLDISAKPLFRVETLKVKTFSIIYKCVCVIIFNVL